MGVVAVLAAVALAAPLARGSSPQHVACGDLSVARAVQALGQPVEKVSGAGKTGILAVYGTPALPDWSSCLWQPQMQPVGVTSTLSLEVAGPFSRAASAVAFYNAVKSGCRSVARFGAHACLWTGVIARLQVKAWMLIVSSGRVTVAADLMLRTPSNAPPKTTAQELPVLKGLMRSALKRIAH
jgi:hypothetical protein